MPLPQPRRPGRHHPPVRRRLLAAALGLALPAAAQTFSYPDFTAPTQLSLLGNATLQHGALRLTANTAGQSSWVWRQVPMTITYGFTTSFTFRLLPSPFGTKGEGFAFVVHGDPLGVSTTSGPAWGLGYGSGSNGSQGIRRSLALEVDTFRDLFLGDTSDNELSLHTRGTLGNNENESAALARTTPATNLADGQLHTLSVRYQNGLLEVFLDGATTPALSRPWSHTSGGLYANGSAVGGLGLTNDQVWVGFTGTTGAGTLTELAELTAWTFTATSPKPPCYQGSFGNDLLTVAGQTGGPLRTVRLGLAQSFGIGLATPSTFGPGAGYVLFASLLPQPGAPGTQLGFGETCFPVLPTSGNELVLGDSLGLGLGLLPVLPAPYTLALPAGLVSTPLDFTVQAVMLASASPLAFGVSNAIDVEFRPAPAPTVTTVTPPSAVVGGTITVNGTGFLPGARIVVGGSLLVTPTTVNPTQVQFAYPAGVPCGSSVAVQNPDGQLASAAFNPQLTITSTALASGPAAGNQLFVILGTGFAPGTVVTIDGVPATPNSTGATTLTVFTPPGTPGPKPVVVTSPGGCSATTTYTYL
jgi:hypothetical protein